MIYPCRGEVWWVNLDPVVGHEQGLKRPALVMSVDKLNQTASEMAVVIPLTTKLKGIPIHVRIDPPEGGLSQSSEVKCDQIRALSTQRFTKRCGAISAELMREVEDRVRIVLGL